MKKHLLIPEDDVQRLEAARLDLHELLDKFDVKYPEYCRITEAIWYVTHRKYEVVEREN